MCRAVTMRNVSLYTVAKCLIKTGSPSLEFPVQGPDTPVLIGVDVAGGIDDTMTTQMATTEFFFLQT